jgi:hypothetical protein
MSYVPESTTERFHHKNSTPNTFLSRFSLAHVLTPYANNLRFNIIPRRWYNAMASVPLRVPLTCALQARVRTPGRVTLQCDARTVGPEMIRIRATRLDDVPCRDW